MHVFLHTSGCIHQLATLIFKDQELHRTVEGKHHPTNWTICIFETLKNHLGCFFPDKKYQFHHFNRVFSSPPVGTNGSDSSFSSAGSKQSHAATGAPFSVAWCCRVWGVAVGESGFGTLKRGGGVEEALKPLIFWDKVICFLIV